MYQAAEWALKCTYVHTLSAGFAHAAVPAAAAPPWARANAARAKPALAVAQPPPAVYAAVGRASAAVGRAGVGEAHACSGAAVASTDFSNNLCAVTVGGLPCVFRKVTLVTIRRVYPTDGLG